MNEESLNFVQVYENKAKPRKLETMIKSNLNMKKKYEMLMIQNTKRKSRSS